MLIKTGFGYYEKDGKKLRKYELPIGYHPDPVGYTVVEVNSKEDLDRIVLDKNDVQLKYDTLQAQRQYHKNAAMTKLRAIGLLPEEIDALLG